MHFTRMKFINHPWRWLSQTIYTSAQAPKSLQHPQSKLCHRCATTMNTASFCRVAIGQRNRHLRGLPQKEKRSKEQKIKNNKMWKNVKRVCTLWMTLDNFKLWTCTARPQRPGETAQICVKASPCDFAILYIYFFTYTYIYIYIMEYERNYMLYMT